MNNELTGSSGAVRFVSENFAEFSLHRQQEFVDSCDKFPSGKRQAMWVIIQHLASGPSDYTELIDCPAESEEDAKHKLREHQEMVGSGYKCVVQRMLRIEDGGEIIYHT